jgi:hypothetical protein
MLVERRLWSGIDAGRGPYERRFAAERTEIWHRGGYSALLDDPSSASILPRCI